VHLIAGWALWQFVGVRTQALKPEPIVLSLIAAAPPLAPNQLPQRQPKSSNTHEPLRPLTAPPVENLAMPTPSSVPALVEVSPQASPPAIAPQLEAPHHIAAPSIAPITAAGPRQVAASAVRYLVEPQMTVPRLSRRLGESGVVHLRIVVDARGHLKEASLKKSAGFARLDQQALQDIRSARFAPYLENGQAVEWETVALLAYELDR
jgi:protein TonB